jgi:hypothetical protein
MIGFFAGFWKTRLLRAEVVHRLPGRLRLRIPALRMVNGAQEDWAFLWRGLPEDVDGIEEVEVNLTSGSVLISYRPEQLTIFSRRSTVSSCATGTAWRPARRRSGRRQFGSWRGRSAPASAVAWSSTTTSGSR